MRTLKATLLLLTLSLSLWAANHPDKHKKHDLDPPAVVPEGGEPIAHLLVSGAAIAGVLVLRNPHLDSAVPFPEIWFKVGPTKSAGMAWNGTLAEIGANLRSTSRWVLYGTRHRF